MDTRFYDLLLAQVSNWPEIRKEGLRIKELRPTRGLSNLWEAYRAYSSVLTDPNTKRLLFDSRQATVFADLAEAPPERAQQILHTPFETFYLELTEPILVGENETDRPDFIRAFLFSSNVMPIQVEGKEVPLSSVTAFLTSRDNERLEFVDRTWKLHLQLGMAFVSVAAAVENPDPSELPANLKREQYFLSGHSLDIENRHVGWWERTTQTYTGLFSWMMLYCMAKGIYIEQEQITRQQRRWLEQHPKLPQPWHVVKVEPKFISERAEEGEGFHHSYRYDVIGHLRFTQHRVKQEDGSLGKKDYVEWVQAHQRGLNNSLYIPKTYQVEGGKTLHPRFQEYAT